jgi:ribose transport system ATP-binding protein
MVGIRRLPRPVREALEGRLSVRGAPLLEVRGLSKSFPGLRALDNLSLTVRSGEIVAIVGQNGSGKSTFVKSLTGVYEPDPGSEILVADGSGGWAPGALASKHLHVIHQDLGLVPTLSVVENLDLDHRYGWRALRPVGRRRERRRAAELVTRFGGSFDVGTPVGDLTAAERTIVAIARALAEWDRPDGVLILDEPTAALHGEEVQHLFSAARSVAAQGAGVVFISHRLDEVLELCDRVVALRGGRKVADEPSADVHHADLVRMIVGGDLVEHLHAGAIAGRERLSVAGLAGAGVSDATFAARGGEIVGISGLLGSGREHLCGLVFGARARTAGEVHIDGRPIAAANPRASIEARAGYVPPDRRSEGAVMTMSASENLTLPQLRPLTGALGRIRPDAERHEAIEWTMRVELSPPEPERPLELFSGGNQQKIVIARWLRTDPGVLLLDEPTQGVDVGAKAAIYGLVAQAARNGAAVVVASSDERELAALCDRVLVMRDGAIAAEVGRDDLSEETLVSENLGLRPEEVASLTGHQESNDD